MEVLTDPHDVPELALGSALTIGAYDGVHRGHRAVLREVRHRADDRGLPTVVVTFDRHPASVVRPDSAPRLLTDLDQKLEVLAATGDVDWAVVVTFDAARAAQEPDDFVARLLVGTLGARLVVVGEDFHFGRGRQGNVELLRRLGTELGFEVVGLGLVELAGSGPVSSTSVRRSVAEGDVARAAALLGRPYEVRGTVVEGDGRGRQLGYPTANVSVPPAILLPADGIYAGWHVRPDGRSHAAAISLGRRPTFHHDAHSSVLETHLVDFDADLYAETAAVRFVRRLRDEERFDSADALAAQIERDVEATRQALG